MGRWQYLGVPTRGDARVMHGVITPPLCGAGRPIDLLPRGHRHSDASGAHPSERSPKLGGSTLDSATMGRVQIWPRKLGSSRAPYEPMGEAQLDGRSRGAVLVAVNYIAVDRTPMARVSASSRH
jgi:hypothetical protein